MRATRDAMLCGGDDMDEAIAGDNIHREQTTLRAGPH
jgi:hypothetical protein